MLSLSRFGALRKTAAFRDRALLHAKRYASANAASAHGPLVYGVAQAQGSRETQEDRFAVAEKLGGAEGIHAVGVFDGFGGGLVSTRLKSGLLGELANSEPIRKLAEKPADAAAGSEVASEIALAMEEAFIHFDKRKCNVEKVGSTGCVSLMTPSHFIFCNLGDSRLALVGKDGRTRFFTELHKPYISTEMMRIAQAGAFVADRRLAGRLAMSRAFGAAEYKSAPGVAREDQALSCRPDVKVLEREPTDELLVVASDGFWDNYSVHARMDAAKNLLYAYGLDVACEGLAIVSSVKNFDNATVLLVPLEGLPFALEARQEAPDWMAKVAKPDADCWSIN